MSLSEIIVLISGANQGIGFEITKKLATENPSYHILMGVRSLSKGEAAISSLPNLSVEAVQLDVTSDSSISNAVEYVQDMFGRLDVLISNAGIPQLALPEGLSLRERYTQTMDTNAIGPACLTEAFIPLLQKSSNPRIVFMTAGLGSIGDTLDPSYQYYGLPAAEYKASKAALNMVMAACAVKYKDAGFQVNVCCPGLNATSLSGGMGDHPSVGALNACRLATTDKGGETGTFTNKKGKLPW